MQLIHGDCQIELSKLKSNSIDAIIIDPPYRYLKHKLDKDFDREKVFNELYRILKNDSFICIFGRGIELYKDAIYLNDLGFNFKEEIIWDKNNSGSIFANVQRVHELCLIFTKGNKQLNRIRQDFLTYISENGPLYALRECQTRLLGAIKRKQINEIKKYLEEGVDTYDTWRESGFGITAPKAYMSGHGIVGYIKRLNEGVRFRTILRVEIEKNRYKVPTQKPVELLKRLILLTTKESDTVLDCFMGSASCGKACLELNRDFVGIEIDEEYYNIAKQNIEEKQKELKERLTLK